MELWAEVWASSRYAGVAALLLLGVTYGAVVLWHQSSGANRVLPLVMACGCGGCGAALGLRSLFLLLTT